MSFITSHSALWREITNSVISDIYILPEYTALEAKILQGIPLAWVKIENGKPLALIPFVERVIHNNGVQYKDLVSPYGYPGMIYLDQASHEQYCLWMKQFNHEAAEEGYVSSFVRLHPIFNKFQIHKQAGITQHAHGETVSVNLSLPLQDIRQSYSQNHRRNIKRLIKSKFNASVDQWDQLPEFIELYTQTMQRKQARSRYFFQMDYFLGLKEMLGDNLMLVMIYDAVGQPAAGGLFSMVNGLAQFHLGGTADNFAGSSPSKLMMDVAIEQCKERGAHSLHLGGGYGSATSDGLFRFKAGFGSQRHAFSTLRFIHRRDIYKQLMESSGLGDKNAGAYFPEYRFLGT